MSHKLPHHDNVAFDHKELGRLDAAQRRRPNRRAFLGSASVLVSLPFLESLSGSANAETTAPPVRFVAWHTPDGVVHSAWDPEQTGADYALTPTLMPLANVKSKLLVATGIQNNSGFDGLNGAHSRGVSGMLTCVSAAARPTVSVGVSIDQVYAQFLNGATRFASLQLGATDVLMQDGDAPAICNGCISWASATQPLTPSARPDLVFDNLFAGSELEASAAEAAKRKALKTSVLDYVMGEANGLRGRLSAADKRKLDDYLTGVRELERQAQRLGDRACSPSSMPRPDPATLPFLSPELTKVMIDLQVLALACDATRAITFLLGNGGSSFKSFPWLGISEDHHELSHHGNDPVKVEKLLKIEHYFMSQLGYFLEKLDGVVESDGTTMLDNSLVFTSSELGSGDRHDAENKPILIAGSAGGKLRSGRHVRYTNAENQGDLFVALLNALGLPATQFGPEGKRILPDLLT